MENFPERLDRSRSEPNIDKLYEFSSNNNEEINHDNASQEVNENEIFTAEF